MRIDTDRFIVCDDCGYVDHFGNITIREAQGLARDGWKTIKGVPICFDCQKKRKDKCDED